MKRLAVIPVLAFALAGCGSDSGNDEAATSNPSSPPSMKTVPACMALPNASLEAHAGAVAKDRETMYLTDVSADSAECTAKVTFDFDEGQAPGPGYEAVYEPASTAKVEDGSGNPVEIDGDAFLVVRLSPAMTARIDGDQVTKTYTGPKRLPQDPDSAVRDVVKTGDFENMVTWVIGLDEKLPFSTTTTQSQLVIEIDTE
jgi:hypothetical protein